jgi:MFS family permease
MTERRKLYTFYALLVTQTFSLIGSRMTALALGIWIFAETREATPLVLISFFSFLPRLLSASIAGVMADRYDRRYVMAIADVGQAVGTVLLLISFSSGAFQFWHLYAVTILQSVFDMFQIPAFQASVTMLVPDKHRNRANAIQLVTSPVAGIIAPALAGAFYGLFGVTGIITIDLLTFLASIAVLLSIKIPKPQPTDEGQAQRRSIWREAFAGFQFVWERKPLLMIFVFTGLTNFFLAGMISLQTPYILSRTNSESTLGTLLGVYSAGSLAGTVLMAVWGGTKRRVQTMMPGLAILGVALAFLGMAQQPLSMALLLFIMAMFPPINNVSIISLLQIKVPPQLQGRVFAAISQISMTLIPLSYLVTGPAADNVFEPLVNTPAWSAFGMLFGHSAGAGMGLMMTISGIAITSVSLSIYAMPMVRNLEMLLPDYVPEAAESASAT